MLITGSNAHILLQCLIFFSRRKVCCFLLVIIDFGAISEVRTCACNLHLVIIDKNNITGRKRSVIKRVEPSQKNNTGRLKCSKSKEKYMFNIPLSTLINCVVFLLAHAYPTHCDRLFDYRYYRLHLQENCMSLSVYLQKEDPNTHGLIHEYKMCLFLFYKNNTSLEEVK